MSEETLLVSSMGTKGEDGYNETDYVLDSERTESQTKFSPIALAELVEIDRALIARTEKAGEDYDEELEQAFGRVNVPCEFEEISKVQDRGQIDRLMQGLIEMIRERDPNEVVLDITYGFRTLPMVFFATVIHLDALDDIEISGIYYGQFCGGDEKSPIIDMTYLHTLMEWYHAINTFDRTGELRPIHALLKERKVELCQNEKEDSSDALEELVKKLNGTSRYFDSGIPLRAGETAQDALNTIQETNNSGLIGPEERFLDPLSERLSRFSVDGIDDYTDITLDMDEIHRQRELVEFYVDHDRYRVALGCARELFVNRFMLTVGIGLDEWLDRNNRRCASRMLNAKKNKQEDSDEESIAAITLWDDIGGHRNWYSHSGFKENNVSSKKKIYNDISELCEKIDDDEYWSEII